MKFLRNSLVWVLCFLMGLPPEHVWATDQIVVESGATLTETPSGKPMLNIAAPNASGLSHNKFTDFNVTANGLVINNATGLANTSLAGVIEANPNFSGRAATLILNEVTSTNRSYLKGATEIGGQAADYILANPNGITCNGCGFINTPRATLTTGTPTFSSGSLSGLSVNAGDIVVEGLGLDATKASKFDIVTRAAEINAQINADELGIHTGRQDFDYDARSGTAKTHDGSTKPTFSIDSTALGGMYAGRITLVGTEAGVGVRVAGDMATSATDMIITADGKLEFKADVSAKTEIALTSTSSDITTDKTIYAGSSLTATASSGTVTPGASGTLASQGDVTIKADLVTSADGGKIVAGMTNVGAISTSGTLDVQATTKIQTGDGFLAAGSAVKLKGPTVDLSRATDDNSETVRSRGTLTIESGNLTATNGRIASDGAMLLKGNSPIVIGEGTYNSAAAISLTGDSVSNAATMTSDQSITLTSTTGDITNTGSIAATTTTELNSANDVINSGTIESQTGTTVTATNTLDNQSGGKIKSATTTIVNADTITNAGAIYANTTNTVTANTVTNTASIASGTDLAFKVGSLTNASGILFAENNLSVLGADGVSNATLFDNASGTVQTVNNDITIKADTLKNRKSEFVYSSGLVWSSWINSSQTSQCYHWGAPDGGCSHYYHAVSISTEAGNYSTGVRQNAFQEWFKYYESAITSDSASALITSGGAMTLSGTTLTNDNSTMSATGNIDIAATTFNNEAVSGYNELYVYGGSGWGLAKRKDTFTSKGLIQAGGNLTVTATGGVRNSTEQSYLTPSASERKISGGELTVSPKSTSLVDTSSYVNLIPGRDTLFLASADPKPTFLYETRADFINVNDYYGSDYFVSKLAVTPETISTRLGDAYFDTTLVREAIMRETGRRFLDSTVTDDITQMKNLLDNGIAAESSLNLSYGIALSAEQINALTSDIVWYVEEVIDGRLVTVPKVYLASATLNALARPGATLKGDTITITADTIDNDHGLIDADTDVTLTATSDLTSTSADIEAGNDVTLTSTNADVNVTAAVTRHSNAGNFADIQHQKSNIDAGGKLTITANNGDIRIEGTDIETGGDTTLTAGNDLTIGAQQVSRSVFAGQTQYDETKNIGSSLKSGGKLDISAGADAKIEGSTLSATGDATLTATGNVTIASTTDTLDAQGDDDGHLITNTNTASSLTSNAKVSVTSGGTMQVKGSALTAGTDLELQATGNVVIESSEDTFDQKTATYKKVTVTQNRASLTAGGDITVGSLVGNLSLISAELESGGDITLSTPNGQLYLGVRKDYYEEHISESRSSHLTTTYINRGRIDETVVPTLLTADGNIAIVAADGVIVDYKDTGSLTDSIDQLSQSPGLAWMKDVQARSDVTWQAVEEYHHSWDYRSQGISPVGAAVISLAVGYAVGPYGFVEGGMGKAALSTTTKLGSAIANAGFSTLATQAATAIVGNKGDIGAALKQLGSMDTVKGLATAMVTAGMIQSLGLDKALSTDTSKLTGAELKMTQFANRLKIGIAEGVVSSTVNSAINGTPLDDNLKSALASAGVNSLLATTQNIIGDITDGTGANDLPALNMVAHALAGGLAAEALGNDFKAGAASGLASAMAAQGGAFDDMEPEQIAAVSKLIGGVAAAIANGDAESIVQGASIASSAAINNHAMHPEHKARMAAMLSEAEGTALEYSALDTETLDKLQDLCGAAHCFDGILATGFDGEALKDYASELGLSFTDDQFNAFENLYADYRTAYQTEVAELTAHTHGEFGSFDENTESAIPFFIPDQNDALASAYLLEQMELLPDDIQTQADHDDWAAFQEQFQEKLETDPGFAAAVDFLEEERDTELLAIVALGLAEEAVLPALAARMYKGVKITASAPTSSELAAAEHMAAMGKNVELRDPVGTRASGGTSDLLVDGVPYDVYTPITNNPNRIISAIAKKNDQTTGVVLDLSNSSVTPDQLGDILARVNGSGAKNITDVVIIGK